MGEDADVEPTLRESTVLQDRNRSTEKLGEKGDNSVLPFNIETLLQEVEDILPG